ncbi:hypothetical protein, partial [Escherichia coli]|uniref:hypothetical protein n=1 Tax=Escherichia coli TaxID=562 RepID=UPI0019D620E0
MDQVSLPAKTLFQNLQAAYRRKLLKKIKHKTISTSYEFFNIVLSLALLMNKKFKYKKSLLAAILSATLLAGCDGGGS